MAFSNLEQIAPRSLRRRESGWSNLGGAAIAFLLGIVLAMPYSSTPSDSPDSQSYLVPAYHLLHGQGFVAPDRLSVDITGIGPRTPILPETFRTPGYPLILAGIMRAGADPHAIIPIQIALNAIITAAIYLLVAKITTAGWAGMVAALVYAAYPPTSRMCWQIMTETPFTAVLFGAIVCGWLATRRRSVGLMIVSGLLVGASVLIRPAGLYLWLFLAVPIAFFGARRVLLTFVFVLAAVAPVLTWTYRNERVSGVMTVSSNSGDDLLFWRAATALAVSGKSLWYPLTAMQVNNRVQYDLVHLKKPLLQVALREIRAAGSDPMKMNLAQRSVFYGRLGRRILLRHPIEYLLLSVSTTTYLLFESPALALVDHGIDYRVAYRTTLPLIAVVALLFWRGMRLLWRTDRALCGLIASSILYFLFVSASGSARYRYIAPAAPYVAIAAGVGAFAFVRKGPGAGVLEKSSGPEHSRTSG